MESLDVVVVGSGPSGVACAGTLKKHGFKVALVDKGVFPRNKLCAGWVTPGVFDLLSISPLNYGEKNILQPITKFVVWDGSGKAHTVDFGKPVSYGVIRREFDNFILRVSGVKIYEKFAVKKVEFLTDAIRLNDTVTAKMVVGAGGHFCPVSRALGNSANDLYTLAALESETELDERTILEHVPFPGSPEVIYLEDMLGYAWYFSKGNYLNIGLGSLKRKNLRKQLSVFLDSLRRTGRITPELEKRLNPFTGHAYKIYPGGRRTLVGDRALLIGDAAGLADKSSGEGVRPAVLSGILAAEAIIEAKGDYSFSKLRVYNEKIFSSFGKPDVPSRKKEVSFLERFLFRKLLLGTAPGRRFVINKFFL